MGSLATKAFEGALRQRGSMARVEIEKSLLLWAKRVMAGLAEIPELGTFSIESNHSPYEFWAYVDRENNGLIHLKATDRGTAKAYAPETICSFDLPAWMIREIPVESLTEKRDIQ